MNIFRFRDRVGVLDERSRRFLTTVVVRKNCERQDFEPRNTVTL